MSRRRKHQAEAAQAAVATCPPGAVTPGAAEPAPATVAAAAAPRLLITHRSGKWVAEWSSPPNERHCGRVVTGDSVVWECSCGARGPTGRGPDGIPHIDAAVLLHEPGEDRLEVVHG